MSFAIGKAQSLFPALPEKGKPHQEQSQAAWVIGYANNHRRPAG